MPVPLVYTTLSEGIIKCIRREETKILFFCDKLVWGYSISFSNLIRITWIFLSCKIWSYKIRKFTAVIEFSFFTKSCTFFFPRNVACKLLWIDPLHARHLLLLLLNDRIILFVQHSVRLSLICIVKTSGWNSKVLNAFLLRPCNFSCHRALLFVSWFCCARLDVSSYFPRTQSSWPVRATIVISVSFCLPFL